MKNTFLSRDVSFSERTWTSKVCPPKMQRFRQTKVRSSAPLPTQCQKFACLLPGNWSQTVEGRWFPAVNLLGNKEVNRCWLVFCWRLTPCCPPGSIFILLLYDSLVSDILSNAVPTFPLHTCQVCDFYPKRHFISNWRHISRHECAGNCCNRRENNNRQTKKRLWNGGWILPATETWLASLSETFGPITSGKSRRAAWFNHCIPPSS